MQHFKYTVFFFKFISLLHLLILISNQFAGSRMRENRISKCMNIMVLLELGFWFSVFIIIIITFIGKTSP